MTPDGTVRHKIKDKHIKGISGPPHKVQHASSRLKTPTGAEPEVLELQYAVTTLPTPSSVKLPPPRGPALSSLPPHVHQLSRSPSLHSFISCPDF